ncbi:two-component system sensor histidine kinase YesM [Paenibacillus harenae]|uniref:Two-component system sensor histidine kinase YesM n=2 Tax=Paenibacillus harenae TaxID=306543 RepID=A0ABT9U1G9_PAEHA|nr:two-component system sensor histidine kinase YesM [Paenibacillus harenae]
MIFKRMRKFRVRELRLSSKLAITYVLLTVVPIALIGLYSYSQYNKSVQDPLGEYMPKFLNQANNDIEQHFQRLSELSELVWRSEHVLSILRRETKSDRTALEKDAAYINDFLSETYVNGSNPDVLGVYVLSGDQLYYSSRWVFQEQDWKWQLRRYGGSEPAQWEARLIQQGEAKLRFANNIPYVLIKKQLYDTDNRKLLGSMFIAIDLAFIDRIFRNIEPEDEGRMWLMSESGMIVYHTNSELIGTVDANKKSYPLLNGSFRTTGSDNPAMISLNQSSRGLILAHSIPLKKLTGEVDAAGRMNAVILLGVFLLTIIVFVYFSWKFIQPLKRLSGMMKNVEMGKFQVNYDLQSRDEIGTLATSLNSMIATIRDLIQKNYQIEIRQKEAELYALQSQINPHFMYNTLETIGMAVEEGETEAVVDMVTLLGRMLRFSVSNLSRSVTIAEEVQHVKDYLTIQKFRFEDRLAFEIVDQRAGDLQNLYSPKFILQPVVENAIKHGLEKRRKLEIQISIGQEFGARSGQVEMVFRIRDNGPGISTERLAELEKLLQNESFQHKSSQFGLSNVNARIKMMHGSEYGLQLHSIEGLGTEVSIRIPINAQPYENEQNELQG